MSCVGSQGNHLEHRELPNPAFKELFLLHPASNKIKFII